MSFQCPFATNDVVAAIDEPVVNENYVDSATSIQKITTPVQGSTPVRKASPPTGACMQAIVGKVNEDFDTMTPCMKDMMSIILEKNNQGLQLPCDLGNEEVTDEQVLNTAPDNIMNNYLQSDTNTGPGANQQGKQAISNMRNGMKPIGGSIKLQQQQPFSLYAPYTSDNSTSQCPSFLIWVVIIIFALVSLGVAAYWYKRYQEAYKYKENICAGYKYKNGDRGVEIVGTKKRKSESY